MLFVILQKLLVYLIKQENNSIVCEQFFISLIINALTEVMVLAINYFKFLNPNSKIVQKSLFITIYVLYFLPLLIILPFLVCHHLILP